jgi:hypothetical protein
MATKTVEQTAGVLAILVGGGPAPGINAVIAAATIEARKPRTRGPRLPTTATSG